jgi:hypothetical protein
MEDGDDFSIPHCAAGANAHLSILIGTVDDPELVRRFEDYREALMGVTSPDHEETVREIWLDLSTLFGFKIH